MIVAEPSLQPSDIKFTNKYEPTAAELTGTDAIHGTKTLDGREMKEGETFYFQLTQTSGPATVDPEDGDAYVTVLQNPETTTVAAGDGDMAFNFSGLTFPQTGEYTFTVNEVAADGAETADGSGLTYDKNICTVTVNVTDNKQGALVADVAYANQGHDETDQAVFTNTYKASMDYGAKDAGGINVTKQMLDRPMDNNEFSFAIAGADSNTVKADEANAKLADADKSFQNTAAAENGTATMAKLQNVSFDQNDAGKTFSYLVSETVPADWGQAGGRCLRSEPVSCGHRGRGQRQRHYAHRDHGYQGQGRGRQHGVRLHRAGHDHEPPSPEYRGDASGECAVRF